MIAITEPKDPRINVVWPASRWSLLAESLRDAAPIVSCIAQSTSGADLAARLKGFSEAFRDYVENTNPGFIHAARLRHFHETGDNNCPTCKAVGEEACHL